MKMCPVGTELFHADGHTHTHTQGDGRTDRQTYMTKLIAAFRNFANAPKNEITVNGSQTLNK